MAGRGGAGKVLNKRRLSKMPAGGETITPEALHKQQEFIGNTRMSRNGSTPGRIVAQREREALQAMTHDDAYKLDAPKKKNSNINDTDHMRNSTIHRQDAEDRTFINNISDPNQLFKFASYNTIFTLSVLSTGELKNTKTLLSSAPHDIIIRSGGIGAGDTSRTAHVGNSLHGDKDASGMSKSNRDILEKNERMRKTLEKSQAEFRKNRDLYFKSVTMNNVPGLNEKRRLTSVTQVNMEIIEPWGISLLSRLKAGAANNNFLDHLDAPYMLTVEFVGWDEKGMPIPQDVTDTTKRIIPIKLTNMSMDVNQSGTTYQVQGIPYNEFAYVNRYNFPRTSGTIEPKGRKLSFVAQALEDFLNRQNEEEQKEGLVQYPDKYIITIDEAFKPDTVQIDNEQISQSPMYQNNIEKGKHQGASLHGNASTEDTVKVDGGRIVEIDGKKMIATDHKSGPAGGSHLGYKSVEPIEYMKINSGNSIIKILEEIMKSHPQMTDDKMNDWQEKVKKQLTDARDDPNQDVDARAAQKDMYFDYFRIRSSVVPLGRYDSKRQKNQKEISYVVEPYKVHPYSMAIPGVSTGQNMKSFVYKTYNYIFTGENVDILNLDIKYKVAYFTSVLKDVASAGKENKIVDSKSKVTHEGTEDDVGDQDLLLSSEPGIQKSSGTGKTSAPNSQLDQFMDQLTHPLADMVNIRLEILGDPAWLGVSQFIPAVPFKKADGVSADYDIKYWRGDREAVWNDKYHCYNSDIAEPIIMLNFRMPTDANDVLGTYEIARQEQATFSGLYRVVQVEHNWDDGRYTNVLTLVRFNNQGVNIKGPDTMVNVKNKDGSNQIMTAMEFKNKATQMMGGNMFSFLGNKGFSFADIREKARSNIFRKVDNVHQDLKTKAKNIFKNKFTKGR